MNDALGLSRLVPVDLPSVVAAAALWERVDRKYVVPLVDAAAVIARLDPTHRVLEIDGRRATSYASTYFDTADLQLCRDHLQGRRRRWKARSRLYIEDDLCRFEVKAKGDRGETLKHFLDLPGEAYGRLGVLERGFLAEALATVGLGEDRIDPLALRSVLAVEYTRSTLVDLEHGRRVTLDRAMTARPRGRGLPTDRAVHLDAGRVIVETKGGHRPAPVDLLLREAGHRPVAISKYASSASLLAPALSDNAARRLLGRGLHLRTEERRAS